MMVARMTPAEARQLGLLDTDARPARVRTTRRTEPRAGAVTVCHTCGARFTTEAAEARHAATTRHARYDWEMT